MALFCACLGPSLTELDYAVVDLSSRTVGVGSIYITGRYDTQLDQAMVTEYGFVISTDGRDPTVEDHDIPIFLNAEQSSTSFDTLLSGLSVTGIYRIRAFVTLSETSGLGETVFRTDYSDIDQLAFDFGLSAGHDTVCNNVSKVEASVIGLNQLASVLNHGFVYSQRDNPEPSIMDGVLDLGPLGTDGAFEGQIPGLQFNTTYYFRSFVETTEFEYYYSDTIVSFSVLDGWKTEDAWNDNPYFFGRLGPNLLSFAVSPDNSNVAYIGIGCNGSCLNRSHLSDRVLLFDPSKENPWDERAPFKGTPRVNGISTSLGDMIYYGTGEITGSGEHFNDFWRYDPNEDEWTEMPPFPGPNRSGAVAFSIGNTVYAGLGEDEFGDELKDIHAFTPAGNGGVWNGDITPLPISGAGLRDAVAFVIGGYGYVGSGIGLVPRKEFWRYDPMLNEWDEVAPIGTIDGFEGATAFVINEIAYVGTGFYNNDSNREFWKYQHDNSGGPGTWEKLIDFQGRERYQALGFSIMGKGYIGMGKTEGSPSKEVLLDIWEYTPKDN